MSHTPGPWTVWGPTGDRQHADTWSITGPPTDTTGELRQVGWAADPADARLIAAAPELLEALEVATADLLKQARSLEPEAWPTQGVIQLARAVIAKARGES